MFEHNKVLEKLVDLVGVGGEGTTEVQSAKDKSSFSGLLSELASSRKDLDARATSYRVKSKGVPVELLQQRNSEFLSWADDPMVDAAEAEVEAEVAVWWKEPGEGLALNGHDAGTEFDMVTGEVAPGVVLHDIKDDWDSQLGDEAEQLEQEKKVLETDFGEKKKSMVKVVVQKAVLHDVEDDDDWESEWGDEVEQVEQEEEVVVVDSGKKMKPMEKVVVQGGVSHDVEDDDDWESEWGDEEAEEEFAKDVHNANNVETMNVSAFDTIAASGDTATVGKNLGKQESTAKVEERVTKVGSNDVEDEDDWESQWGDEEEEEESAEEVFNHSADYVGVMDTGAVDTSAACEEYAPAKIEEGNAKQPLKAREGRNSKRFAKVDEVLAQYVLLLAQDRNLVIGKSRDEVERLVREKVASYHVGTDLAISEAIHRKARAMTRPPLCSRRSILQEKVNYDTKTEQIPFYVTPNVFVK
jgi:hypothetical protein